jgi:hypothetical protein
VGIGVGFRPGVGRGKALVGWDGIVVVGAGVGVGVGVPVETPPTAVGTGVAVTGVGDEAGIVGVAVLLLGGDELPELDPPPPQDATKMDETNRAERLKLRETLRFMRHLMVRLHAPCVL